METSWADLETLNLCHHTTDMLAELLGNHDATIEKEINLLLVEYIIHLMKLEFVGNLGI